MLKTMHAGLGLCIFAGVSLLGLQPACAQGLGINLSPISSVNQEIPFVDAMKESQPFRIEAQWIKPGTPVTGTTTIDANGWVASLANNQEAYACVFQGSLGYYPAGIYTLLYDGVGTLTVTGSASVISSAPGVIKVSVTPVAGNPSDNGVCIRELSTNPSNYITNIRFIMPGYLSTYQTQPFYPPFLASLAPFKTIRFIGWDQVNGSTVVNWADRRSQTYATQALSTDTSTTPVTWTGVAPYYEILLANQLNADPWFLIPTKASDDYITQLATLTHKMLNPNLHPHIEFSNEIWNSAFPEYAYARAQGTAMNLDPGSTSANTRAGLFFYALTATHMFQVWNNVWGADASRIIHVISGESYTSTEADTILGYQGTAAQADVLAIAPYIAPWSFGSNTTAAALTAISQMKPSQVLTQIQRILPSAAAQVSANYAVAAKYNLKLVTYEGGIDLNTTRVAAPYRAAVTQALVAADRDPGMQAVYTQMLSTIEKAGASGYNHFDDVETPSAWGSFGMLEYETQAPATAPKFEALANYVW